ncbi:hypothetical protein HET69_28885 [Streptomyces sp. CJ_13]|uniref:hypothetical protein n=1 Tax=Streptomyces sp. CJ_13 TaxID=2724943 RepID=UPI001BDC1E5A|nr:hypothetical protein [Streptomyces sp. CJ_13]MBT1187894.1 hypothetical protein [Streptomyces sp. CJ_13]
MTTTDLVDGAISFLADLPSHTEQLAGSVLANAWWVALVAVGVGGAAAAVRWALSRGPMSQRTALEVLPTTGFDPKPEEVIRFGHQVARAHKSVSRWLVSSTRTSAIRVRFTCSDGSLSMRVEGPDRAMSVLRHQGYAQVEMRPVEADGRAARERPQIRLGS